MYLLFRVLAAVCGGSSVNSPTEPGTCLSTGLPTVGANSNTLHLVLQLFFAVLGALSVLFVVIGGLRYTISGGDAEDMKKAKNTIMYAIIGLIVALTAEAIVTFALSFLK